MKHWSIFHRHLKIIAGHRTLVTPRVVHKQALLEKERNMISGSKDILKNKIYRRRMLHGNFI